MYYYIILRSRSITVMTTKGSQEHCNGTLKEELLC